MVILEFLPILLTQWKRLNLLLVVGIFMPLLLNLNFVVLP